MMQLAEKRSTKWVVSNNVAVRVSSMASTVVDSLRRSCATGPTDSAPVIASTSSCLLNNRSFYEDRPTITERGSTALNNSLKNPGPGREGAVRWRCRGVAGLCRETFTEVGTYVRVR